MKQKGFTLAEVLITLTIIGVIAAITIPNLVQKYTKHTYVVGLKKVYSQLQNAIKMIPLTEGCPAGDFECSGLFDANNNVKNIDSQNFNNNIITKRAYLLSKQIKIKGFCGEGSSIWINSPTQSCYRPNNASPYSIMYSNKTPGIITQDGMIIVPGKTTKIGNNYSNFSIYVDINGDKKPNKNGIDVFSFTVFTEDTPLIKSGTVIPSGSTTYYRYVFDWGRQNVTCPGDVNCTARVLENNKMDY